MRPQRIGHHPSSSLHLSGSAPILPSGHFPGWCVRVINCIFQLHPTRMGYGSCLLFPPLALSRSYPHPAFFRKTTRSPAVRVEHPDSFSPSPPISRLVRQPQRRYLWGFSPDFCSTLYELVIYTLTAGFSHILSQSFFKPIDLFY